MLAHKKIWEYQGFFPVPKPDSKRVVSLVNRADLLSFRHHVYAKEKADVHLYEAPASRRECAEIASRVRRGGRPATLTSRQPARGDQPARPPHRTAPPAIVRICVAFRPPACGSSRRAATPSWPQQSASPDLRLGRGSTCGSTRSSSAPSTRRRWRTSGSCGRT